MSKEQIIVSEDAWNGAIVTVYEDGPIKFKCSQKGWEAEWYDIPEDYSFQDVPEGYVSPLPEPGSSLFQSLFKFFK